MWRKNSSACWGSCAKIWKEKVQEVRPLCLCSTVHSRDVPSEPVEAPVPGCDSGRGGGTGSTTMSKSDTFQGPGGFRTPSAPGRVAHKPTTSETETLQRQDSTDTWERRREKEGNWGMHKERGRLERKEKSLKSSPGGELSEKSGRKETVTVGPRRKLNSQASHARCAQCVAV